MRLPHERGKKSAKKRSGPLYTQNSPHAKHSCEKRENLKKKPSFLKGSSRRKEKMRAKRDSFFNSCKAGEKRKNQIARPRRQESCSKIGEGGQIKTPSGRALLRKTATREGKKDRKGRSRKIPLRRETDSSPKNRRSTASFQSHCSSKKGREG